MYQYAAWEGKCLLLFKKEIGMVEIILIILFSSKSLSLIEKYFYRSNKIDRLDALDDSAIS